MEKDELTLSDVHVHQDLQGQHLGQYCGYKLSRTRFIIYEELEDLVKQVDEEPSTGQVDEDGDLDIRRIRRKEISCVIYIDHTLETRLDDLGLQVWQGCFLLCDYLLSNNELVKDKIVLELGAGVGLASIIAARSAKSVLCTDVGNQILEMCAKNAETNRAEYTWDDRGGEMQSVVQVHELDWTKHNTAYESQESADENFGAKYLDKFKGINLIIAADVVYDDALTTAFCDTVDKLLSQNVDTKLIISLERRLNFTLQDLEVACPAHDHFIQCISTLSEKYLVKQVDAESIRSHFNFARSKHLELWILHQR